LRKVKLKVLLEMLLLVLVVVVSGSAYGRDGCSLQGSWIGFHDWPDGDELVYFIAQITGKDESHGNTIIDFPGFDATLGRMFPTAVGNSDSRGIWERIDGNTFAHTAVSFAVDADGNGLYIMKLSNVDNLADDCNVSHVTDGTLEFYWPWDNPFDPTADPFYGPIPARDHDMYRMHVE
jgi:hypothetical protein